MQDKSQLLKMMVEGEVPNMASHRFTVEKHYVSVAADNGFSSIPRRRSCKSSPRQSAGMTCGRLRRHGLVTKCHKTHKLWRKGNKVHCTQCKGHAIVRNGTFTPSKQLSKACGLEQSTLPMCFRPKEVTDSA